ncbi:AMP-binding protein [Embleya hyalina]|uniref:Long-chain-fatty-acid--CoA ligase n=1 Tax=Embleya hyalina TaxID=516124 RepID=A0A401YNJ1_9ACTN|nr:AMP-binding protein [Embleya hyalina]GCD96161.1 long-chain-fatty-acid--CoA ligase [Embleya hyalina]
MVNVASLVWRKADASPRSPAVRSGSVELTFGQLREASGRVATAAHRAGVGPLDRVVLVVPTVPEFPIVYYGLHTLGATVVTLNTMATPAEIGHVLQDARPSLVIAWEGISESAEVAAATAGVPFWRIGPGAHFEVPPRLEAWEHQPDDTAIILYTSGTTGRPKGAELTAANLVANAVEFAKVSGIGSRDRVGTALPLFHVYGQAVIMNTTLVAGGSLTLCERFQPRAMLELVRDGRLTALGAVPTMWIAMLREAGAFRPADFERFRLGTSGGATIPVEVLRAYEERLGCTLLEGYGLSETTGVAAFNDIHKPRKAGTVGVAMPGAELQIRKDGTVLGPDDVGEVYIRGTTVMKGYWNRPEATRSELVDGWLRTGDLGCIDAEGYLTIVGRTKELIIRGGYNVYPREVEEVLYRHPDIVEAAVLGVPDDYYGEEVGAAIVLRPGAAPDPEGLKTWAKSQLSAYKVPHLIAFVDELPKGSTGKILKRSIDPGLLRESAGRA